MHHAEQLLCRNVERFPGGLVFKAHRLWYPSILGLRVMKKKRRRDRGKDGGDPDSLLRHSTLGLRVIKLGGKETVAKMVEIQTLLCTDTSGFFSFT